MMLFKIILLAVAMMAVVIQAHPSVENYPQLPLDGTCEAGKTYRRDCNTCYCYHENKAVCTQIGCLGNFKIVRSAAEKSELPELPLDESCEIGKVYKKECNICRCFRENEAACTKKRCASGKDIQSAVEKADYPELPSDRTCEAGKVYKKECNTCVCPRKDLPLCTRMLCPGAREPLSLPEEVDYSELPLDGSCEVGKTYKKECNLCKCPRANQPACTKMFCYSSKSLKSVTAPKDVPELPLDGSCEAGKIYKKECNTCICGRENQPACTRMLCNSEKSLRSIVTENDFPKLPADGKCEIGKTYKKECNTCLCLGDNVLGCTYMECDTSNQTRSVVNIEDFPELPSGHTCEVGKHYKKECNACYCFGENQLACTLMQCDILKQKRSIDVENLPELPSDRNCTEGEHYKLYNKLCICAKNGLALCNF